MRTVVLLLFLFPGLASASSAADRAEGGMRADAPHAYLVRQGETEADAAARFVKAPEHWPEVWCPWPGYEPPVAVGAGDLLVRVRINGRTRVQRARRGDGDRPHARELEAFGIDAIEPFVWVPDPQLHPPQHIAVDLAEAVVHEPLRAIHREVSRFWAVGKGRPRPIVRVEAGRRDFLDVGTALLIVPSGGEAEPSTWLRAVVVTVFPSYGYAALLERRAWARRGDVARSPMAWCVEDATAAARQ